MPGPTGTAVRTDPYVTFAVDRSEALHLLRALLRAAASCSDAPAEERAKARADADAYDELRSRLLDEVARRDIALDVEEE